MTPEQKQRAIKLIAGWRAVFWRDAGNDMAALLQELIDAPAPSVPDEFYNAVTNLSVELEELVAETSGVYGLHLNGAPSPWEEILEGGRFERISSLHVVQNLLAAQQPEQPADLVRDAERYRWLRDPSTDVATVIDKKVGWREYDEQTKTGGYGIYEYRGGDELDAAIDAARAAQKGGES